MLNYPKLLSYDLSAFDKAYSGGAPVSEAIVEKLRSVLGIYIHNVYGMTETTSPVTIVPLRSEGPVDAASGALSVGMAVPGHQARVVDLVDSSVDVGPGEEGELAVKGPGIIAGYWNKPEETANAIKEGWMFTGDIAKMDAEGWCYIVDRKKDQINTSGYKVWPREVEDVLYKHPGVMEAAVVGVPDDYRGETVKAFVALKHDFKATVAPEDLIAFCKERMAAYKYPRIVEIMDELPKTVTGKYLRRILKKQTASE
jgi:long-chain acyl-CoA synthetase